MDRSDCRSFCAGLGVGRRLGNRRTGAGRGTAEKWPRRPPCGAERRWTSSPESRGKKIEVQLIPRDASQCRLLITNKTDRPLSVKMPASFAGVPVLAQAAGLPGPGFGPGGNNPGSPLGSPAGSERFRSGSAAGPGELLQRPARVHAADETGDGLPGSRQSDTGPAIECEIRPMTSATDKAGLLGSSASCWAGMRSVTAPAVGRLALQQRHELEGLAGLQTRQAIGSIPSYTRRRSRRRRRPPRRPCSFTSSSSPRAARKPRPTRRRRSESAEAVAIKGRGRTFPPSFRRFPRDWPTRPANSAVPAEARSARLATAASGSAARSRGDRVAVRGR